jgi:hypothetical protein
MKYCQGPKCHEHKTKDRIRGSKGNKYYETRKSSTSSSRLNYLGGNACSMTCERDWFDKFGNMAVDHFGRIHEPKRTGCDSAWYKSCMFRHSDNSSSYYDYYFINDLLGERRSITEQQFRDNNFTTPN